MKRSSTRGVPPPHILTTFTPTAAAHARTTRVSTCVATRLHLPRACTNSFSGNLTSNVKSRSIGFDDNTRIEKIALLRSAHDLAYTPTQCLCAVPSSTSDSESNSSSTLNNRVLPPSPSLRSQLPIGEAAHDPTCAYRSTRYIRWCQSSNILSKLLCVRPRNVKACRSPSPPDAPSRRASALAASLVVYPTKSTTGPTCAGGNNGFPAKNRPNPTHVSSPIAPHTPAPDSAAARASAAGTPIATNCPYRNARTPSTGDRITSCAIRLLSSIGNPSAVLKFFPDATCSHHPHTLFHLGSSAHHPPSNTAAIGYLHNKCRIQSPHCFIAFFDLGGSHASGART